MSRLLYLFMLCIYLLTARGQIQEVDFWASLMTAEAILRQGTLAVPVAAEGITMTHGGYNFSKYGIGAAVVLLPFVALSDIVGAVIGWDRNLSTGAFPGYSRRRTTPSWGLAGRSYPAWARLRR